MALVDTSMLREIERLPGWRARIFNSASMTFAHYEFDAGSTIHQHHHEQEEVWNVIEGELEITIGGVAHVARPGVVAIVPPNTPHSVRALSDGRAIIVDHPLRFDVG
jgi:quercetin dioxygenase-like cupin family protein